MKFNTIFKQEEPEIAAKIKAATKISMDEAAREKTRALLSEYVKMRPIRASEPAIESAPAYNRFSTFFMRHSMPAFAAVLVIAVGGSTAAAAEGALPGDILYPIKVHVNEEMRATLAVSPKAKADWAVDRAERRLEEAATLALSGELNEVTRAEIDTGLDEHVRVAGMKREQLEKENSSDAVEVQKNISAVLIARANILDNKLTAKTSAGMVPATLTIRAMNVRSASLKAESVANFDATTDESEAEARGHRTAAKVRIEATKRFLGLRNQLATSTRMQAETRLRTATENLSSGDAEDARGNKEGASLNFDSALEAATEIETIISVSSDSGEQKAEMDLEL